MAACFFQHALASFAEDKVARQRIAFEIELRARCIVPLAALCELLRHVEKDRAGHDFIDQADFFRTTPIERLAFQNDVQRRRKSDQPREFRGASPRRKNPELRLRQSDRRLRAVRYDAPIATDGDLAAAAETRTIDCSDRDLRELRETMKRLLAEA